VTAKPPFNNEMKPNIPRKEIVRYWRADTRGDISFHSKPDQTALATGSDNLLGFISFSPTYTGSVRLGRRNEALPRVAADEPLNANIGCKGGLR
jgi:hypothetical protein